MSLAAEELSSDWTIPSEEITQRKLVKQTPKYKIYKADYFGDVLLYEPIVRNTRREESPHTCKQDLIARRRKQLQINTDKWQQDSLSTRLEQQLNLDLDSFEFEPQIEVGSPRSQCSLLSPTCSEQDSAYSSISSTPHYHTKRDTITTEFEFPTRGEPLPLQAENWSPAEEEAAAANQRVSFPDEMALFSEIQTSLRRQKASAPTVVLNRDSFEFQPDALRGSFQSSDDDDSDTCGSIDSCFGSAASNEAELRELWFVAHENFMLFMGAAATSMDARESESTSLVMQISDPKAISLFNLLHASNLSGATNLDRRATCYRQPLSVQAKLNICKQVTHAMTYLHDRNIVHARLTSVNIYIEPSQRVKISLIDNDERPIAAAAARQSAPIGGDKLRRSRRGASFNLPTLTYLSPELIKTIEIKTELATEGLPLDCDSVYDEGDERDSQVSSAAQVQIDTSQLSKKSDVFAFGTLLFELFEERFPFAGQSVSRDTDNRGPADSSRLLNSPPPQFILEATCSASLTLPPQLQSQLAEMRQNWNGNISLSASELIFQIGSGQISQRNRLGGRCPALVERIIAHCWSHEPSERPNFKQLAFA